MVPERPASFNGIMAGSIGETVHGWLGFGEQGVPHGLGDSTTAVFAGRPNESVGQVRRRRQVVGDGLVRGESRLNRRVIEDSSDGWMAVKVVDQLGVVGIDESARRVVEGEVSDPLLHQPVDETLFSCGLGPTRERGVVEAFDALQYGLSGSDGNEPRQDLDEAAAEGVGEVANAVLTGRVVEAVGPLPRRERWEPELIRGRVNPDPALGREGDLSVPEGGGGDHSTIVPAPSDTRGAEVT